MLAYSFLIKSSSKLLVSRTGIKTRSSSILGRIRPLILELLALKWWKFHTFQLEYLWSQLANLDEIFGFGADWIIRFWGRLDHKVLGQIGSKLWFPWQQKAPLTYNGENDVSTFSRLFFIWSFLYLQVTRTCIKSRTSLNFSQIGPLTMELAALEV